MAELKLEFTVSNPSREFLNLLFPFRSKQAVKKDLMKHLGSKYYNLSIKSKLQVIEYWKNVLNTDCTERKYNLK